MTRGAEMDDGSRGDSSVLESSGRGLPAPDMMEWLTCRDSSPSWHEEIAGVEEYVDESPAMTLVGEPAR